MKVEHEIKCWPQYFLRISTGQKTFEIRKNDRDYQIGDILIIQEFDPKDGYVSYSKNLRREIVYTTDFMQQPGYIVLGIAEEKQQRGEG